MEHILDSVFVQIFLGHSRFLEGVLACGIPLPIMSHTNFIFDNDTVSVYLSLLLDISFTF